MANGYRLFVYKADRRTKSGERFVKSYDFHSYNETAIKNEIKDLKRALYRPADGWRLEYEPLTKMVKNLMSGKLIEIDYRTPRFCDPSSEAYWSM